MDNGSSSQTMSSSVVPPSFVEFQENFESTYADYQSYHKTLGCHITHMIGVPIIALAIPLFFGGKRKAGATMFTFGWILQLIGHYVFERNKPYLLTHPGPMVPLVALKFVVNDWIKLLQGKSIVANDD